MSSTVCPQVSVFPCGHCFSAAKLSDVRVDSSYLKYGHKCGHGGKKGRKKMLTIAQTEFSNYLLGLQTEAPTRTKLRGQIDLKSTNIFRSVRFDLVEK